MPRPNERQVIIQSHINYQSYKNYKQKFHEFIEFQEFLLKTRELLEDIIVCCTLSEHTSCLMEKAYSVGGQKHYLHLERSHLSSSFGIVYNVIRWSLCERKRDL